MMKKWVGFTLIELMIVIALISILAVLGTPTYQQYIKKARFSEVVSATIPLKTAIAIALQSGIPIDEINSGEHGIPDPAKSTKNLLKLEVKKAVINAASTEIAGNATYILKPNEDGSEWHLSGTCLKNGLCHA